MEISYFSIPPRNTRIIIIKKKVYNLHAACLVVHATRPQHVSDKSTPTQNRRIFSEPLSENDFRALIYITSVPRSMHSKDPREKYLAASSKRSTRLKTGKGEVKERTCRRGGGGGEGADARHHRIQKVGYDRLLMRALPGGCIARGASRRGVYQVGCQGNGGGIWQAKGNKGEGARYWLRLSRSRRRSSPASSTEKRPRETRGGKCITGMMNDPQVA